MERVLVTGASRGLGLEFVRQYAQAGCEVIATCREPARAGALTQLAERAPRISIERLDVTDHRAIDALAARLGGTAIDILVNNAGDIGPRDPHGTRLPEQLFGTINYVEWQRVLAINTLAPLKMAEAFAAHVAASAGRRMIFMSSSTGSNVEGKFPVFAYCSSKAALNKAVTMLAMVLRSRGIICAAVCPGHVRTELGGEGATLEVEESIAGLRRVIGELSLDRSGSFTRYDGTAVAW